MTVSSLWKVLDKAGCGKAVGAAQLANPSALRAADRNRNPLNNNINDHDARGKPFQTLAVDLSIWICESLTSHGMNEQNSNPALHLVFTRTMKLLNLGIHLVFVVEGKQRIRDFEGTDANNFRKRRSGTAFWKACNDSQQMLELLGVPVVRAKSEGEALCALLSARGIVDGVISNDGDCLLFGAKIVYTKYSNDNLDNGRVMRYDLDSLQAVVDASDEPDISSTEIGTLQLSRHDLISFALLTGSDLAGSGLEKVGHKKAIRFIRKCQLDNPLSTDTASLDEMRAWAKAATADVPRHHHEPTEKTKCCSRCTHGGSKRSHKKHGCEHCGTGPGEQCYLVTSDDRFRKSLRAKALDMRPKFDPSQVFSAYMRPNENQLPMQLIGMSLTGLQMGQPRLSALMQTSLIVKGHSLEGSRAFVRQAVLRLLSRTELRRVEPPPAANGTRQRVARERPIPKAIIKALLPNQVPCYEVAWVVNATVTDENGDGVDGFEYVTVEPQELIELKYPSLTAAFKEAEIERAKQGDGMKNQRRDFLDAFLFRADQQQMEQVTRDQEWKKKKKRKGGLDKKREEFFQNKPPSQRDYQTTARKRRREEQKRGSGGDDIGNLLRFICKPLKISPAKTKMQQRDADTIASEQNKRIFKEPVQSYDVAKYPADPTSVPQTPEAEEELVCAMGGFDIAISPIESNQGVYPPKHIFVYSD